MRVLVVQCCHLPQFFYVVENLQARHPNWELEALFLNEAEARPSLAQRDVFRKVHFLDHPTDFSPIDQCVFPLLNRGYWKIKRIARRLSPSAWETDYQGNLTPLEKRRLWLSLLRALHHPTVEFAQYVRRFPLPPLGRQVLLLESAHPSLLAKAEELLETLLPPDATVIRLGNSSFQHLAAALRRQPCESAVVFFSGESGYARLKLFPFLWAAARRSGLRMDRILVFDENLNKFYVSYRKLIRFCIGRMLQGASSPQPSPRILFVQTESPRYVLHALERLKERPLFPRSEVVLLCREEDRERLMSAPQVWKTLTYSRRRLRENLKLLGSLRRLNLDMTCAIFSGRPWFRRAKLLFLLLPIRRHLVFNAKLDYYELSLRTFFWLFRREPLLFESPEVVSQRVLLLQTEHFQETRSAYHLLHGPKVAPGARVSVFCAEEDRSAFENLPGLERLFTWSRSEGVRSLSTLREMIKLRPDVVAALFSGRPVFRKQKLLFFLFPARRRVVFNPHLDCFYLNWRTLGQFLAPEGATPSRGILRKAAKVPLFFVRFAYLSVWVTIMKLRRAAAQEGYSAQRSRRTRG